MTDSILNKYIEDANCFLQNTILIKGFVAYYGEYRNGHHHIFFRLETDYPDPMLAARAWSLLVQYLREEYGSRMTFIHNKPAIRI
jgi:hypothetical protein